MFAGPSNITITAVATDSNGINKVEFFDNGELIGQGTFVGSNTYSLTKPNVPHGVHALIALATDNLGRTARSDSSIVLVNGPATVSLISPTTGTLIAPGSDISLVASATDSTNSIAEVEFFANDEEVGEGTLANGVYSLVWQDVAAGSYKIRATVKNSAGIHTVSSPVTINVGTPPTIAISNPIEGTVFPSQSSISLSAAAQATNGSIVKVDFYANGTLIGSASDVGTSRFTMTWRQVADGAYSITAIAFDQLGLSTTSEPLNLAVNTSPLRPGEVVWFDDALPAGANPDTNGDVAWYWVTGNPGPFSGNKAHQSLNFRQVAPPAIHSHSFAGATAKLHVDANDKLFTYVFLDPNNMPREIMLEWKDAGGWEHRAYWGQNIIDAGVDGTASRRFMGSLPRSGEWVRLEVLAFNVGLSGSDIDGMSFVLAGGRATWDMTGKTTPAYVPPPATPIEDATWIDGSLPAGAATFTQNDHWNWIPCEVAVRCHQSVDAGDSQIRQHSFTGGAPQRINAGDQMFTYVFLDPNRKPDQLFIQWFDGKNWRRAFWGTNWIDMDRATGTENWRYMGGLPTPGTWARLVVPASYLGLEGKFVSGMAFGFYKQKDNAQILWGRSGKTKSLGPVPVTLSAMTPVWQFFRPEHGYYYQTKDTPLHSQDRRDGIKFYIHPSQAAGTVPVFRFTNGPGPEYVYTNCENCPDVNVWQRDGIAFYVFENGSTPGTVPLYLFRNTTTQHYFLGLNPTESGMANERLVGYVHLGNPLVPARPSFLTLRWSSLKCSLAWLDNSSDETKFRIEKRVGDTAPWGAIAEVGPNVTKFSDCALVTNAFKTNYRVFAVNDVGDSMPSNEIFGTYKKLCKGCIWILGDAVGDPDPESDDPSVTIASPADGAVVPKDLTITADAFDADGNGSLARMEFYSGTTKLGELTGPAPYNFMWNNAPNGPHTLTVVVTDGSGMTAISSPVHITVTGAPSVSLTSPVNGAVVTAPGNVSLAATASDPEGSLAKVEFYQGEVKIGEDTTSPYSFPWNSIQAGTYEITARAIDSVGLARTSAPVVLTVNSPPTITLTTPSNGEILPAPSDVQLLADVMDTDGRITKVDFYHGTTLIGTTTTVPFMYNWTSVPSGNYTITAKVTDNDGAVTTSAAVNLIVNSAPTVSITSPANHAMVTPWSNVVVNANASDPDGTITQVDFYQGTTLITTDTTSPYSVSWNVASGSYTLTAKATDNRGVITTSSAVVLTTPVFFDDFNDNSLNATKWSVSAPTSPAVVTEQDQALRITLPASTATYNGILSNATYDLRGATVQVELAQAVSQAGHVENMLKLEKDAQNYLLIDTGAGNTLFRSMVNGVSDQLIISFDSVVHRYWRIRHDQSSNSVSFETSPDAVSWTIRKTVTAGFSLSSLRFALIAGAFGTGNGAPGAAIYNDFQYIPGVATVLADDFNDNSINTSKWNTSDLFSGFTDSSLPISETAERFEIGPLLQNTGGSHYRGLRTVDTYDFTGGAASVELVQPPAATTQGDAMFTIGSNVDNYYRIYVTAGNLIGLKKIGGTKTTLFTVSYDAVNHRYLRIRHDAATSSVILETAPNSGSGPGTWVQQFAQLWNSSVPVTSALFEIKGGTWQAEANAAGKVIFDNFLVTRNPQVQSPTLTSVSPSSGPDTGGTVLTLSGTQFAAGATVSIGGASATNVNVTSSTSISATTPAHVAGVVSVTVTNPDGGTATLSSGYTYTGSTITLLSDDFNDNSIDASKWTANDLFSGFTDTAVPLSETVQRVEIGALLLNTSGSHYRGLRSVNAYDFTGGSASIELVQPAAANTQADAMFTIGTSVDNYYRLYVSGGNLIGQKKIGGTKTPLFTISYDSVNHRYLRIRHDASSNNMILETAPSSGAGPGTWVQRHSESWNSGVTLTTLKFEIKGGTWQAESNAAGKVIFDNFSAIK